jgi:hypothetical protein
MSHPQGRVIWVDDVQVSNPITGSTLRPGKCTSRDLGVSNSAGAVEIWRRSDSDQAWHNGNCKQYDSPGIILTVHRGLPGYA